MLPETLPVRLFKRVQRMRTREGVQVMPMNPITAPPGTRAAG